ncbi:hypothetical protein C8F04DRAFT_1269958 [Mycena alexandri]|uniref:Uncharacterized protein n=1 Tax=Mycena alexandri TaxID=1745969 RepID=A0AAD6WTY9_9AGAR|nr:hypothetical protein C8F04DRAFT_1269958 [Mycena alexandri]
MNIITTLLALTAMCMGKPASIVVRNDPYASQNPPIQLLWPPTAQTAQTCGPDEDAALQTLFSSGQYQSDTGDTRDNITVTDLAFQTWAIQQANLDHREAAVRFGARSFGCIGVFGQTSVSDVHGTGI